MRKLILLLLSVTSFLILLSCRKQNDDTNNYPASYVTIVTSTFDRDTILGNLTIEAGHRELPEIIMPPKHALKSQIERQPGTGWYLYHYRPTGNYKGKDSVMFFSVEPVDRVKLTTKITFTVR